ncbi:MAG: Crp/Fnr family transcriptional regulator [Chloroflexi bacterium]|nr:Crp/Fnr family transcriptional regulator [Chloroflexota bacterium]
MTNITYEKLASISIFQELSKETLGELAAHCRLVNLAPEEILFRQGDTSRTLYLVESGTIQVSREYDDGERIVLARLGPHEVIGELSMMCNKPRVATVNAIEETALIALDNDVFFAYLGKYPNMAVAILAQLSHRLRAMDLKFYEMGLSNAPARLASLILFLAEEQGEVQSGLITTNFRLQRIARAADVDIDWLQNQLADWSDEGYIGIDGRRLLLHDPEILMNIAGWE